MRFLKRKPKQFDYKPRYYKGKENPFKIEHKLDKYRVTVGKNKGFKSKLNDAINDLKNYDKKVNVRLIIIISILIFIFLYIIDFDLTIFKRD